MEKVQKKGINQVMDEGRNKLMKRSASQAKTFIILG